jgi:hypothetical protein
MEGMTVSVGRSLDSCLVRSLGQRSSTVTLHATDEDLATLGLNNILLRIWSHQNARLQSHIYNHDSKDDDDNNADKEEPAEEKKNHGWSTLFYN